MLRMDRVKFTTKFFCGVMAILIMTILSMTIISTIEVKEILFDTGKYNVSSSTEFMINTFYMENETITKLLNNEMEALIDKAEYLGMPRIEDNSIKKIELTHANNVQEENIGTLFFGGTSMYNNIHFLEEMQKMSSGEITLFQLANNKLIRIATTLADEKGKSLFGTYLTEESPVYKTIVSGQRYMGRALVANKWYTTVYSPIKNTSGEVIGAFFVGQEILSPQLHKLVSSTKVLGEGYFFVYDSTGMILIDPVDEGTNIFDIPILGDIFKNNKKGFVDYVWNNEHKTTYIDYFEPWDWYIAVGLTDSQIMRGTDATLIRNSVILGLGALLLGTCIILLLVRIITKPIIALAANSLKVADGDYTVDFKYSAKDALGNLAESMNTMVARTKEMLRDITSSAQELAASSKELSGISSQMTANSGQTATMATTVSSAAEEVSSNMNSASAAMEEAAINMNTVAAAAEEMSATIQEIAQNSERARDITAGAVAKARESSESVHELGDAAKEINAVTATIAAISSQTNLLALNATIEAARAGEAGRGFAVVANEIKELAQETAKATEDIREKILGVQSVTDKTVSEIDAIGTVIGDMNDIVGTIAASVEEQSATTREIAENVGQASSGITELNHNVAVSSGQVQSISKDIEQVRGASDEMSANSQNVQERAHELARLATRLQELVSRFTI